MKGYRFYKEYDSPADKRKDRPNGNVFAAMTEDNHFYWNRANPHLIEGFGAVYFDANSPCVYCSADIGWLGTNCKRISEAEARKIHPALFARIEE